MSIRSSVFASLLAWAVFLALGSGNAQFLSSPAPQEQPHSTRPAVSLQPTKLNTQDVLTGAREKLRGIEWLVMGIRQAKHLGDTPWECEGTLTKGPKGCVRLEMTFKVEEIAARKSLVISDGRIVAEVAVKPAGKPNIKTTVLPEEAPKRDAMLNTLGCGGPAVLLDHLRAAVASWQPLASVVDDTTQIVLIGTLPAKDIHAANPFGPGVQTVRLFFNASSLWLDRVEWWHEPPGANGQLLGDIDYRQPRVNQALSLDECARVFSYRE